MEFRIADTSTERLARLTGEEQKAGRTGRNGAGASTPPRAESPHAPRELFLDLLLLRMRQLNGVFTQASNRHHHRAGHLFQGRFKAILVDKESYLLELSRYVVLNPVRAGMVDTAADWPWSSYRATAGECAAPAFLTTDALLSIFGTRKGKAREHYIRFVAEGVGQDSPRRHLQQQIYLGDETFVRQMQAEAGNAGDEFSIPKLHRRVPAPSLTAIEASHTSRDEAMIAAHATGAYSYREIAAHFGLHPGSAGRIVRRAL